MEGDRAIGVRSKHAVIRARRAVICNVTPQQLYLQLLDSSVAPTWVAAKAKNFRYGRGDMQIHQAQSEPPRWPDSQDRFARTAIVHVSGGLDAISRAVNEAEHALHPADRTIVLGQPTAVDPSRAPAGSWIYWIQLQELPSKAIGDAAGELDTTGGEWTESLREEFADRVIRKLEKQIPNVVRPCESAS